MLVIGNKKTSQTNVKFEGLKIEILSQNSY